MVPHSAGKQLHHCTTSYLYGADMDLLMRFCANVTICMLSFSSVCVGGGGVLQISITDHTDFSYVNLTGMQYPPTTPSSTGTNLTPSSNQKLAALAHDTNFSDSSYRLPGIP